MQPEKKLAKETIMRAKIMKRAFELMAKKGIDTVSMREIAAACHVTKPVLYYYFKDKEDLCRSIIGSSMADYHEQIEDDVKKGMSLKEICEKSFQMHLEYFKKEPKRVSFFMHVMSYAARGGKKGGQTFIDVKCERKNHFERIFKTYEEKGEIPAGSASDILHLTSSVTMHYMMNTLTGFRFEFDSDLPRRMNEIIFLGVKEFYKKEKRK